MAENTALRNNALPYPIYGAPWAAVVPILDADGDPILAATALDSEISLNGDTIADAGTEATIGGGLYSIALTAANMTADVVAGVLKSAEGKTTCFVLYPRKLPQIRTGTAQAGAAGTLTLDASASAIDDHYNGCACYLNGGTGSGQVRVIADYIGSTKVASVTPNWATTPDATSTFIIYLPEGRQVSDSNVKAVSDDATAADNCELMFDGTGYAGGTTKLDVTLTNGAHGGAAATLTLLSAVVNNTSGVGVSVTGSTTGLGIHGATIGLDVDASGGPAIDVDATGIAVDIDGTTGGMTVNASAGTGAAIASSGGNGHGISIAGNGTGDGMEIAAGASGDGIETVGGSTTGSGFVAKANQATSTGGSGIAAYGYGTNGYGIRALGGSISGPGMSVEARANNDAGLVCLKNGTGKDIDADQIDTIAVDVAGLDGAAMRGTDNAALASVCTEARLAELDAANLPTDVANVKTDTAAILIDTAVIGAAGAGLTAIPWNASWDAEVQSECADALTAASVSTLTAAQVNAEVVDAINVDTHAEPGQEAPPATASLVTKIGYLFKGFRNKWTQTATEQKLFADNATTVDQKATISDDLTTFTRGELGTGP